MIKMFQSECLIRHGKMHISQIFEIADEEYVRLNEQPVKLSDTFVETFVCKFQVKNSVHC